jgi:hypothetical protein
MNSLSKEQVIECYMMNSQKVLAELLYDTITRYESRTCSNCKHWEKRSDRSYDTRSICNNEHINTFNHTFGGDFGCNKFEEKE